MIEVVGLSKYFYQKKFMQSVKRTALKQVGFKAEDGKITALLGPNGAGKTTLLRILAGLDTPSEGSASINQLSGYSMRHDLGFLSDGCGLYSRLTAYENIEYFAHLHHLSSSTITKNLSKLTLALDLEPLLYRRVDKFSQGEKMRVNLARTLIHDPQTIILDEPANGLDIMSVRRLRDFLKYLATDQGGRHCILISSHIMSEVQKLADTVVVLVAGEIKAKGSVNALCEQSNHADFEEAFVTLAGMTL